MSTQKDIWKTLSKIDVNKHTEKKNGFTYLSWTWAWATLQENYPESTYAFRDDKVHADGSVEVWVDLQVEGVKREMWLAVTDFKNKAIQNPSCDLVANARMRCLVKAIAMFGLGHYIYAGESLPMQVEPQTPKPITVDQASEVNDLISDSQTDVKRFLQHFSGKEGYAINSVEELPERAYKAAVAMLNKKLQEAA